jgi:hypothetical protein
MIGKASLGRGLSGYRPRSGTLAFRIVQCNGVSSMKYAVIGIFGLSLALFVAVTAATVFKAATNAVQFEQIK